MQRLYEGVFDLDKLGSATRRARCAGSRDHAVRGPAPGGPRPLHGWLNAAATLTLTLLWLLTPYLLLGRRVSWQRLLPGALLTAIGMAGVGVWSVIWMPHTLASSASQFGVIGIGFALLTWLVAVAGVIVVADHGRRPDRRPPRPLASARGVRISRRCCRLTAGPAAGRS